MNGLPTAIAGDFLHCLGEPRCDGAAAVEFLADHVMVIDGGQVASLQPATSAVLPAGVTPVAHPGKLIVPGFIDTHVHYPQIDVIASHGLQLLEWLERYTFPAELAFADAGVARQAAEFFLDELMKHGTTTALVFATVHPHSVDAFFEAAQRRELRMLCGKVMMDRHAPPALCDTPASSDADSRELIERWHNRGRLGYAVTPRFAPTSTAAQLSVARRLLDDMPDLHLHTHLAENRAECTWVGELFPDAEDYLGVYEQFDLVRRRSVFAHGIYLPDSAWRRLGRAGAGIAHCPTSNLFIGSGLFDLAAAEQANVRVGLGTDVGGGDSYSLLRTINEAYKVQQLQGTSLAPEQAFYMATLGGARVLDLESCIGNFLPGKEADLVILDPAVTPLLARRTALGSAQGRGWQDTLFALMMLGDDRAIHDTLVLGRSRKRGDDSGSAGLTPETRRDRPALRDGKR